MLHCNNLIFTFVKPYKHKIKKNRDIMKDRIAHIMRAKNLKASDFASLLGIQPSGISHILSGRNQPSLDFIKKIKETFPEYNLDWIIFGSGPMTTSEPLLFRPESLTDSLSNLVPEPEIGTTEQLPDSAPSTSFVPQVNSFRSIKAVMILYNDGTFENFSPQ